MKCVDLFFDTEGVQQWDASVVIADVRHAAARGNLEKVGRAIEGGWIVDHDRLHTLVYDVTDRSDQEIAFRIKQTWRTCVLNATIHLVPESFQIRHVTLELELGGLEPCGSHDESEILRKVE